MHRRFWIDKVDTLHFKDKSNWSRDAVAINVEFLTQKYIDVCKRKRIQQIVYMDFSTTMGIYRNRWCKRARIRLTILNVILLFISLNIAKIYDNKCTVLIINCLAFAVTTVISLVKKFNIEAVLQRLFFDTWGYYFVKSNNKDFLVSRAPFFQKRLYNKFITRMNGLAAFFCIWINDVNEDDVDGETRKSISNMYKCVFEGIDSVKSENHVVYMPLFIIGFFAYEKNIMPTEAREICGRIINANKLQYLKLESMIYSQLFYLTKNRDISSNRIKDYLIWLRG